MTYIVKHNDGTRARNFKNAKNAFAFYKAGPVGTLIGNRITGNRLVKHI